MNQAQCAYLLSIPSTLEKLPIFIELRKHCSVQPERGRVEFLNVPTVLAESALKIVIRCVACGQNTMPFRERNFNNQENLRFDFPVPQAGCKNFFYSATCLNAVRPGCNRTKAAEIETKRHSLMATEG